MMCRFSLVSSYDVYHTILYSVSCVLLFLDETRAAMETTLEADRLGGKWRDPGFRSKRFI